MKKLLLFLLLFPISFFAYSQFDWDWHGVDSSYFKDSGYILLKRDFVAIDMRKAWGYKVPHAITNDSLLKEFTRGCTDCIDSFNFNTHIILQGDFLGDCHAKFEDYVYLDTIAKKLIWRVYNIYGGCRAGGGKSFVFKIPKPPIGYTIKVEEVLIDEIHNRYEWREK